MISINVKITLVVVLVTPVSLFVAAFIAKRTHSMFQLQSKTRGEQTALIDSVRATVTAAHRMEITTNI